ncbi:MAG: exodeoxyribonuclease V subunit gamma [Opitutales bacterium]|nr:exodeoxyribonuclease V subunit gamma [Opitutales bacterium]
MNHTHFNFVPAFSLETLADRMIDDMKRAEGDIMEEKIVLVMNPAQGSWLKQYIARKTGICANIHFCSPDKYFNSLLARHSGDEIFAQLPLAWRIFKTFQKNPDHFNFKFRDNSENDLMVLADILAKLFWSYQTRRPEMIDVWQRKLDDSAYTGETIQKEFRDEYHRQKKLWQALELKTHDVPACRFVDFLSNKISVPVPRQIFVFAPTAMPRLHYRFLQKLSDGDCTVNFYYHNLSSDLWTETESEKKIEKDKLRSRPQLESEEKWIESVRGNELLTTWGKAARKMAMQLIDDNLLDGDNRDEAPAGTTLLQRVQADIRGNVADPEKYERDDDSLLIHAARSPLREIEILYDELSKIFEKEKNMNARDVIVLVPDIESYAQEIHAVFGADDSAFRYTVNDRKSSVARSGVRTFLNLLGIIQNSLKISDILELFNCQAVLKKFSIEKDRVKTLRKLILDSNWKNGYDAETRRRELEEFCNLGENAPEDSRFFYQNSYEFAKRRLILGLALNNDFDDEVLEEEDGNGIAPVKGLKADKDSQDLLEIFFKVIEKLQQLSTRIKNSRSPEEWSLFIKEEILEEFFCLDNEFDIFKINSALDTLSASAKKVAFEDKCNFASFLTLLKKNIDTIKHRAPEILRGGITFCELQPMRNISSDVVCIVGLSTGEFPRQNKNSNNDLTYLWDKKIKVAGENKIYLWDRTAREDDCLLLLESVLAAKKYLRLSYISGKQTDNKEKPPASPLGKFIEYLCKIVGGNDKKSAAEKFIKKHPLQDFEDAGTRIPSLAKLNKALSEDLKGKMQIKPIPTDKEHLGFDPKNFSLNEILDFYNNPGEYLFKKLNLRLPYNKSEETENPELDPLKKLDPLKMLKLKAAEIAFKTVLSELENGNRDQQKLQKNVNDSVNGKLKEIQKAKFAAGSASAFDKAESETISYNLNKKPFLEEGLELNKELELEINERKISYSFPIFEIETTQKTKKKTTITNHYYILEKPEHDIKIVYAFLNEIEKDKSGTFNEGEAEITYDFKLNRFSKNKIPRPDKQDCKPLKTYIEDFFKALKLDRATLEKLEKEAASYQKPYFDFLLNSVPAEAAT